MLDVLVKFYHVICRGGGDLKLPQPLRDMVKARFSHRSLGFSSAHTNTADRVVHWRIFIRDYTIFLAPRGRGILRMS